MRRSAFFSLVLMLAVAMPAVAADTGITGQKLVLKVRGTTQKLVFVSKDPLTPFPPIGSADDPSVGGLRIDLITSAASGVLPVAGGLGNPGWKVNDAAVDSYTFKNGPSVRSLVLKQGRVLKVTARNVPLSMTAPLGSVGLRVTMGSTRACALFDASTVVTNVPGNFTARASAAPSDCTSPSLGGSTVCGDGLVEGGETCEATNDAACPGGCTDCACAVCGNGVVEPSEECEPSDDSACPGHCVDCTCEAYCGDGTRDPGELCDGTSFDESICFGQIGPVCEPGCQSCCATAVCGSSTSNYPCCPGTTCPIPYGPGPVTTSCRKICQTSSDCPAGDVCLQSMCYEPDGCTAHAQCGPTGIGLCLFGVCCLRDPGGGSVFCG